MTKKPKVTYKVLKDKALRNLLKECGLPTEGTRQQCIRRHEEFILLYVASLSRRRSGRRCWAGRASPLP